MLSFLKMLQNFLWANQESVWGNHRKTFHPLRVIVCSNSMWCAERLCYISAALLPKVASAKLLFAWTFSNPFDFLFKIIVPLFLGSQIFWSPSSDCRQIYSCSTLLLPTSIFFIILVFLPATIVASQPPVACLDVWCIQSVGHVSSNHLLWIHVNILAWEKKHGSCCCYIEFGPSFLAMCGLAWANLKYFIRVFLF